ncbi:MAG: TolC family protein [Acidobacteriota bacterium]|jgi:hypothetical protein|nr:TolC family protein [Acidobacteriota bacterium]
MARTALKTRYLAAVCGFLLLTPPQTPLGDARASGGAGENPPLPTLEVLESMVGESPEVLTALAVLARDRYALELEAGRLSPSLVGGLGGGFFNEPEDVTSHDMKTYGQLTGSVGVSFPLLGSWSQKKIARLRAEIQASADYQKTRLVRLRNLTALRKAYFALWSEQRKLPILQDFLDDETHVMTVLRERMGKNLLLESDYLEFGTAFDAVRREVVESRINSARALNVIDLATGRNWSIPAKIETPEIPGVKSLLADISTHPALLEKQEAEKLYEDIRRNSRNSERSASLDVTVPFTLDIPGSRGVGIAIGFTIREPFGALTAGKDVAQLAASADAIRARHETRFARMRLEGEFAEQVMLHDYARESLDAQVNRLLSARRSVFEKIERYAALPGDTFEQLQQSRYALVRVAMDLCNSELLYAETAVEMTGYVEERQQTARTNPVPDAVENARLLKLPGFKRESEPELVASAAGGAASVTASRGASPRVAGEAAARAATASGWRPLHRGVFVWDSSLLSDGEAAWGELRRRGITRLLVSFSAKEIDRLIEDDGALDRFNEMFADARATGVTLDLLLGDPHWLLEKHREHLYDLIRFFSPFPFRRIVLDIEPDQLGVPEERRGELLEALIGTVAGVAEVTDLPVALTLHPRYLEGDLGRRAIPAFRELGVSEVILMIYSTNAENVASRFAAICASGGGVRFSLAQSVEAELPDEESYHRRGAEALEAAISRTASKVDESKRAGACAAEDVVLQDWKGYRAMAGGGGR